MTNFGPLSCSLGPAPVFEGLLNCTLFDSGNVPGVVIRQTTGTVTQTWSGGRSDAAWAVIVDSYDLDGRHIAHDQVVSARLSQASASFSYLNPLPANRTVVSLWLSPYVGQSMTGTVNGSYSSDVFCQYGTRQKIGTDATLYLTPTLLAAWLDAASMPFLAPVFVVFWFTTYNVTQICSGPPKPFPPISGEVSALSLESLQAILDAVAWFNLCECVPGSPSPVPFPPPTQPQPPGLPTPPTFGCSNVDVCASIIAMQEQLAALSQTLHSVAELTTLMQRYRAPFAYIDGVRHSGLTGEDQFLIPRLVGLMIEVTARSGEEQTRIGNPDYVYDLGWIAIWDRHGLVEELRLTRDLMVWLPTRVTDATRFTYSLRSGVTIAVTELEAEP